MKAIYFEDTYGERRLIGKEETDEQVWKVIDNFLKDHKYKTPYVRTWEENGEMWYDVGSHTEFFISKSI